MQDDLRSYPGYLARLFGLILAVILIVFAIMFFVNLGDDETGVVVTEDEQFSVTENLLNGTEIVTVDPAGDSLVAATESEVAYAAEAQGGSGTLPSTGVADVTAITFSIAVLTLASVRLASSRRQLRNLPSITG